MSQRVSENSAIELYNLNVIDICASTPGNIYVYLFQLKTLR